MFSTKFITFGLLAVSAAIPGALATCNGAKGIVEDCCWGGTDNYEACNRQLSGANACWTTQENNWCVYHDVLPEDCDADCCSISQKIGIGCPK